MSEDDKPTGSMQFNCFSPPVMIATMIVETVLAVYTVWRYRWDKITRMVAVTLVTLAGFQLAEYMVCTGHGFRGEQWSRIGFVLITLLPPLGIHILHELAGKPGRRVVAGAYATAAAFIALFLIDSSAFIGHQCTGNYVIFQLDRQAGNGYSVYYFGWLLAGIGLGMRWADELRAEGGKAHDKLRSVQAMSIGYLVFLVPTALANVISPSVRRGIPSVLCGFAVLFALILSLYILPRAAKVKAQD